MSLKIESLATGVVLNGALNRETVPTVSKKQVMAFFSKNSCQIDFSGVTHVDTAGLAWALLLVEKASQYNCEINFINLPQDMVKLAQLSAVDTLFPSLNNSVK